ncbi:flippase [Natrialbaceae archaeon A-gly3]
MSIIPKLRSKFRAELGGRIIAAVASMVLVIILARLLDPNDYGLLFLSLSVLGVLKIFTRLGIAKSAARYVSEYKTSDPTQIRHIVKYSLKINIFLILLVCSILIISYEYIVLIIGVPELIPFILLGVFYLVSSTLKTYVRVVLQGFEAIKSTAVVHVLDRGGRLIFALLFVLIGYGALGALLGYILSFAIATIVGFVILYFKYYKEHPPTVDSEAGLQRQIVEYMLPLTATDTANKIEKEIDTLLVGFFLNPASVSFYVLGKQVVTFAQIPADSIGFTLSPTMGAEKAQGNVDQISRVFETVIVNTLLLYIPAAAGLILISDILVSTVFGSEYSGAIPVLQIFGLYIVLQAIVAITSNTLDYLGRARSRAIAKSITALLNLLLNIILIPRIGVIGAVIATLITHTIYTSANIYLVFSEFHLQSYKLARDIILITIITTIMSLSVYITIAKTTGIIALTFGTSIGFIIWLVSSFAVGLIDKRTIASTIT